MTVEEILTAHANGNFLEKFKYPGTVVDAAIVYGDGSVTSVGGPCHACVSSSLKRNQELSVVITRSDPSLSTNPGALAYYDWLINRSFFSDVFLCKDAKLSLEKGFVKRTDVEAAKWLGAAQLGRLATSEYRNNMLAVYDILASGFDIHPTLLTFFATLTDFQTDGKAVYYNSDSLRNALRGTLYNYSTTHLPLYHFNSSKLVKEACKDDPNKPYLFKGKPCFNQGRWPSGSHSVLTAEIDGNGNSQDVKTLLQETLAGQGSLLFNAVATKTSVYVYLWEAAVNVLKEKDPAVNRGKTAMNLTTLEAFSKQHNLGA
jgi:hypothetical protein